MSSTCLRACTRPRSQRFQPNLEVWNTLINADCTTMKHWWATIKAVSIYDTFHVKGSFSLCFWIFISLSFPPSPPVFLSFTPSCPEYQLGLFSFPWPHGGWRYSHNCSCSTYIPQDIFNLARNTSISPVFLPLSHTRSCKLTCASHKKQEQRTYSRGGHLRSMNRSRRDVDVPT